MKNRKLLFAGITGLAVSVTPIITLAACAKKPAIEIDEKEKTKTIEKGERSVIYSIKVNGGLNEGESLKATVEDVTSTQEGYTVAVTKEVEFKKEESIALVTVDISSKNELIKDGTEFDYSIKLDKLNSEGTVISSNKIEGFKLKYGVPTTKDVEIEGSSKTYTNPGESSHTFMFKVGSTTTVDKDCTFECDVNKVSEGSASDVDVVFDGAKYDEDKQRLFATFRLAAQRKLVSTDVVNFNFTLSCKKDGKEL